MPAAQRAFEVEQAGCEMCAARVRDALAPLATVRAVDVDSDADMATVRVDADSEASEGAVNRALLEASENGHSYRVKPGSWRIEPATS